MSLAEFLFCTSEPVGNGQNSAPQLSSSPVQRFRVTGGGTYSLQSPREVHRSPMQHPEDYGGEVLNVCWILLQTFNLINPHTVL